MASNGFMDQQRLGMMAKEKLIDAIVRILKTDRDLDFLLALPTRELEILVVSLRELLDRGGK
jgi:hypothetical protein